VAESLLPSVKCDTLGGSDWWIPILGILIFTGCSTPNTVFFGEANVLAKSPATPELLSDQWQKATVSYDGTTISATFGSTTVSAPFTLAPRNYCAKVVAATGFFYNQHKMRNPVFIPLYGEGLGDDARSLTDSPPLPPVELLQPNPDHT